MDQRLKHKTLNYKTSKENKGGKLLDIGLGNDFFFFIDDKCKGNKSKINKWDYIK